MRTNRLREVFLLFVAVGSTCSFPVNKARQWISAFSLSRVSVVMHRATITDVVKPIAAPIVGGMVTSTIHVLILVPVFFALMKERALRRDTLRPSSASE